MEASAAAPTGPATAPPGRDDASASPPSAAPSGGPFQGRRGWRALAWRLWPAAFGVVAATALLAISVQDAELAQEGSDLVQPLLFLLAAVFAADAARRLRGPTRRGWALLAYAFGFALLFYVVYAGLLLSGAIAPDGDAWLPLLAAVNALSFAGVVLVSPAARGTRLRLALDGLVAGGSLLMLVLAVSERRLDPAASGEAATLTDLLQPAMGLAALAVAGLALLRLRRGTPAWYALLASGLATAFIADALLVAGAAPANWAEALFLVHLGILASAAALAVPWPDGSRRAESFAVQAAVYVPFALAVLGATYDRLENGTLPMTLFTLFVALVGLILVRTILLLRENKALSAGFAATDEFKTQLLRFISHEIANPLSPLKLQVGLLKGGMAREHDKAWATVERSIGRLEALSRDVRLMALVETHRLVQSTAPADLAPRIAGAVQAYQVVAAQRGIRLRPELPATLPAPIDGERFDQVVDNLLSNAMKFTPAGGTVDVRLWRAPGGHAVLEVQDSGAGMGPDQQARLFSAFGRPQGSTTPGLGLGLYLCKAIIDGHGGRISGTSDGPGRGSRFRIELPPAHVDPARQPPGPAARYQPAAHGGPDMPTGRPPDLPV